MGEGGRPNAGPLDRPRSGRHDDGGSAEGKAGAGGQEVVDPDRGLRRDLHAAARRHDRHRGAAGDPTGLHASLSDVQWTLDAYALTLACLMLTSGVLADRYGRK